MIDLSERDILLVRRGADERFVIFTTTDVQPGWPLPWWVAVLDTGGDGIGVPVRLDASAAPDGWTAAQLIEVALARARAEAMAGGEANLRAAASLVLHLAAALRSAKPSQGAMPCDPVTFEAGPEPSPFSWAVARCDGHALPFAPDAGGVGEGITLVQVLIVLDQLLHDGVTARPYEAWLWHTKRHVVAALAGVNGRGSNVI